jgi:hypothetical protein
MIISEAYGVKLKKLLGQNPLEADELRRVKGMGALYISLVSKEHVQEGYEFLYSYRIEDKLYNFYSGPELISESPL